VPEPAPAAELPDPDYFADVCDQVLGAWLRERGFFRFESYCSETMSAWRRGHHFIRVSYWPRDAPRYPLMVGIGVFKEGWGLFGMRKPMLHGLGLWEVVDEEDREVLRRTFRTKKELERLLTAIRERALPHGEAVLDDPERMRHAITHRVRAS
jgi:hypothetical protein